MIDKNEIRCGNWFRHNESWCYKDNTEPFYFQWDDSDWDALGECTLSLEDCDPIPLSEEVLVKCGFEKTKRSNIYRCYWGSLDRMIFIGFYENGIYPTLVKEGEMVSDPTGAIMLNKIDYLHELMNFYYFLTKEEIIYTP